MEKTKPAQKRSNPLILWLPPVLWAAVIFAASSISQVPSFEFFFWDFAAKKVAHVTEYAVLFALIFRAAGKNFKSAFILTILYAVTDEIHQSFVPGRTSTVIDFGLDVSGANIAAYILYSLAKRRGH